MKHFLLTFSLLLAATAALAADTVLAPYKDKLFAYPPVIDQAHGGAYLNVAYDKQRDIYGRDTIPLRKVHRRYVTETLSFSRRVRKYWHHLL